MSNCTWVQACALVLDRKICASVWPWVSRIWASFQSLVQSATVLQRVSVEWVQYQKLSWVEPVGTVTVWARLESPAASGAGSSAPRKAEDVPVWARVELTDGLGLPAGIHGPRRFSKPGSMTTEAEADGVAALEGADVPPGPVGLAAATVKV